VHPRRLTDSERRRPDANRGFNLMKSARVGATLSMSRVMQMAAEMFISAKKTRQIA
jgi:hypothetical protein